MSHAGWGAYGGQGRKRKRPAPPPRPAVRSFIPKYIHKPEELTALLAGSHEGLDAIYLQPDFGVEDKHLDRIGARLGRRLLSLQLGSSSTGDGSNISCEAVLRLIERCPNLMELKLESCWHVDNRTFHAILSGCPNLEQLTITGHDKISGHLKGKSALRPLMEGAAPNLKRLVLTDQGISHARLAALHHARGETMEINGGHSDGDSMAAQMVMRMQGGNWGDNLYSNRTNGYDMYEDMADDGYGYCEDGFDVDAYDWCGEGEDAGEESSSDEDTDEDGSDAEDNSASHGSAGSK